MDRHSSRHIPLLPHLEHIDPCAHVTTDVPGVLHLQLAAVSTARAAHRVDLAHTADRLRRY